MLEAMLWGSVAGLSLVIGAIIAIVLRPPLRVVGIVMAFGAGTLIAAVAYDLIGDAILEGDAGGVGIGLLIGALVFFAGDWYLSAQGAHRRKSVDPPPHSEGEADESGLAIVLGTVLDGVPESFVMGLALYQGGGAALGLIVAIFLSNLPEAIGGTSGLARTGWAAAQILIMWCGIAAVTTASTMLGYAYFREASDQSGARIQAFAAGAIIAMLATTMIPEANRLSGRIAGVVTAIGFALGVALAGA